MTLTPCWGHSRAPLGWQIWYNLPTGKVHYICFIKFSWKGNGPFPPPPPIPIGIHNQKSFLPSRDMPRWHNFRPLSPMSPPWSASANLFQNTSFWKNIFIWHHNANEQDSNLALSYWPIIETTEISTLNSTILNLKRKNYEQLSSSISKIRWKKYNERFYNDKNLKKISSINEVS